MKSNLFPEKLLEQLPELYSQENVEDPLCLHRFISPDTSWIWYVIEGGVRISGEIEDIVFFGYVVGDFPELGYFTLTGIELSFYVSGMTISRDLFFEPTPLSRIKEVHDS